MSILSTVAGFAVALVLFLTGPSHGLGRFANVCAVVFFVLVAGLTYSFIQEWRRDRSL